MLKCLAAGTPFPNTAPWLLVLKGLKCTRPAGVLV